MCIRDRFQPGEFGLGVLIAGFGRFALACDAVLHNFQICKDQFHVDGINIAFRIHAHGYVHIIHYMDNILVVKAAHHMDDGVAFPDMAQEFIA